MERTTATNNQPASEGRGPQQAEAVDLATGEMPALERARIIQRIRAHVREHPEEALNLQRECHQAIEQERPPSEERTLSYRAAARRIGVTCGRVAGLCREGRLGGIVGGTYRFSEKECDEYRQNRRKPGRPRKFPAT